MKKSLCFHNPQQNHRSKKHCPRSWRPRKPRLFLFLFSQIFDHLAPKRPKFLAKVSDTHLVHLSTASFLWYLCDNEAVLTCVNPQSERSQKKRSPGQLSFFGESKHPMSRKENPCSCGSCGSCGLEGSFGQNSRSRQASAWISEEVQSYRIRHCMALLCGGHCSCLITSAVQDPFLILDHKTSPTGAQNELKVPWCTLYSEMILFLNLVWLIWSILIQLLILFQAISSSKFSGLTPSTTSTCVLLSASKARTLMVCECDHCVIECVCCGICYPIPLQGIEGQG